MIISIPFPPWNVCCGYLQFLWRIVLFGTNRESEKFKFVSKSGRALIRYQSGGRGNKIILTLTQPRNLVWISVRVFLTPSTPHPHLQHNSRGGKSVFMYLSLIAIVHIDCGQHITSPTTADKTSVHYPLHYFEGGARIKNSAGPSKAQSWIIFCPVMDQFTNLGTGVSVGKINRPAWLAQGGRPPPLHSKS